MNNSDVKEVIDNLNFRLSKQGDSRCASEDEVRMAILACHIRDLETIISEVHGKALAATLLIENMSEAMMDNLKRVVDITKLDTIEVTFATYCYNCGGKILGNGITVVRHCENAEVPPDVEPDSGVIFCKPAELIIEVS